MNKKEKKKEKEETEEEEVEPKRAKSYGDPIVEIH